MLSLKELITFIIGFAIIVAVASWIGGQSGNYKNAPPDSSWEFNGF